MIFVLGAEVYMRLQRRTWPYGAADICSSEGSVPGYQRKSELLPDDDRSLVDTGLCMSRNKYCTTLMNGSVAMSLSLLKFAGQISLLVEC